MEERIIVEQFGVDRKFGTARWFKPADVKLEEQTELLTYAWNAQSIRVRPPHNLIEGFIKLKTAPLDGILTFARKYGPLYQVPIDGRSSFDDLLNREPTTAWRALSQLVFDLLREELSHRNAEAIGKPKRDSDARRRASATTINNRFGTGQPQLSWDGGRFSIRLSATCLAEAIGLQLMAMLASTDGFSYCPACEEFFPLRGKQMYCTRCGPKEANRRSQRERYQRIKQARQLAKEGKNAREIAKNLKRSLQQIRKWTNDLA